MMLIFQEVFVIDKGMSPHNAEHPNNSKNLGNEFIEGIMVHASLILDILLLPRGWNNHAKSLSIEKYIIFYPFKVAEKELTYENSRENTIEESRDICFKLYSKRKN